MKIGIWFWILMALVLFFGGLGYFGVWQYGYWGSGAVLFVLLALLGWDAFGPPVQK